MSALEQMKSKLIGDPLERQNVAVAIAEAREAETLSIKRDAEERDAAATTEEEMERTGAALIAARDQHSRAVRALEFARQNLARLTKEKEEADFIRMVEQKRKEAKSLEPRFEKTLRIISEIAADLTSFAEHIDGVQDTNSKIADFCKATGKRILPIDDVEFRVRGTPGRVEPAKFEMRELWEDKDGNEATAMSYRMVGDKLVPEAASARYEKKMKRVEVSPERIISPSMPKRLLDEIRLVDREGNQIWPPRRIVYGMGERPRS